MVGKTHAVRRQRSRIITSISHHYVVVNAELDLVELPANDYQL